MRMSCSWRNKDETGSSNNRQACGSSEIRSLSAVNKSIRGQKERGLYMHTICGVLVSFQLDPRKHGLELSSQFADTKDEQTLSPGGAKMDFHL